MGIVKLTVLLVLLAACQNQRPDKNDTINGVWESIGSGWLLTISDSAQYGFYDLSSISCLPTISGDSITF